MATRYLEGDGIFLSPVEETDVSVLLEMQNEKFIRDMMSSCLPRTFEDIQTLLTQRNLARRTFGFLRSRRKQMKKG